MRIHPEIYIVEEAEGHAWIRRLHRMVQSRHHAVLPGHWLISRLQGKVRNRRDPAGTFFGRVAGGEGEPQSTAINVCRESDLLIVVLKHVECGKPCERVERRGRPVRDYVGGKGEPYAEMESCLSETSTC